MNFHEYQAKELFASYGIPVPRGIVARSPHDAVRAAKEMGGEMWVVKAQVHAGGRGKAGGVKLVRNLDEVRIEAERMLNMKISTYQTGGLALGFAMPRFITWCQTSTPSIRGLRDMTAPSQTASAKPPSAPDKRSAANTS